MYQILKGAVYALQVRVLSQDLSGTAKRVAQIVELVDQRHWGLTEAGCDGWLGHIDRVFSGWAVMRNNYRKYDTRMPACLKL